MCLDLDWRDRVHLYGIVATWLLLIVAGLMIESIASEIAVTISPDSAGWRIAFRLFLLLCIFVALLLINAARFSVALNPWSKFLALVNHMTGAANLDTGPIAVSGKAQPSSSAQTKRNNGGVTQPLLRTSAQPQYNARPRPAPQTTITIVNPVSDVPYRSMNVDTAATPSYEALRSAVTPDPTGSVQFAFTPE